MNCTLMRELAREKGYLLYLALFVYFNTFSVFAEFKHVTYRYYLQILFADKRKDFTLI